MGVTVFRDFLARLIGAHGPAAESTELPDAPPEQFTVHGFPVTVINTRPDIATGQALERLAAAFDLIDCYAPHRLHRMQDDFNQIWVRRFPCRAAFFPEPRACLIELTFLVKPEHSAGEVAASLVHEAVHARFARTGEVPADKASEERLCREAELEFGLALPDGGVVVERARQSLLLADSDVAPTIDWSIAARRIADADRAAPPAPGSNQA
jgi:hypothetical protein